MTRSLMLVSAFAGDDLRSDVAAGRRPRPEFLHLEERHGVELLDWTALGLSEGHRSVSRSLRHVRAALGRARDFDVVFSDGEHLGIPFALSMPVARVHTPHAMLAHHLLTPSKKRVVRLLRPARRIDRIIVHSPNQLDAIQRELGIRADTLRVIPFGVDTEFWSPRDADAVAEPDLIVSAGREHRDYATLLAAAPSGAKVAIADHSLFSPDASRRGPVSWPTHVERLALQPAGLRDLYARAAVVVVPIVATDFPAGITTLLEAMSMGKAVVVTETEGLAGVVRDGETGIVTAPGDVEGMQAAIRALLSSPDLRRDIGRRARARAATHHSLDAYSDALVAQLIEAAQERRQLQSK